MMNDEKYFIINKMYVGGYLEENDSHNIGHEVINLTSDDNGDNYIYVNDSGLLPGQYDGKIFAVVLTKNYPSKGCQELLGIATVEKQMIEKSRKDKSIDEQVAEYDELVKYGGQQIKEIFRENTYKGRKDNLHYITFKTKDFYKPKKQIILADNSSDLGQNEDDGGDYYLCKLGCYQFGRQSLRFYISNKENENNEDKYQSEAFDVLSKLMNDGDLMKIEKPEKIDLDEWTHEANFDSMSYLKAMNKIDSENIFSNLMCFFLNTDRKLLDEFCKNVLNVKIDNLGASIKREHLRTDIWINDGSSIIVIENKINSGLNGKHGDQLRDYSKKAEKEAKENGILKENLRYFIFVPNHNRLIPTVNGMVDGYKMIRYKELYKFFKKYENAIRDKEENEKYNAIINVYYTDFLRALKVHCKEMDTTKEESMKQLFYKRLIELRNNKN